ncbi:carbohydrate ABC transporter permease [Thermostaphylospora chromogena]|uniref:Carbohydrate ABC transporter membrane protein 2, CUT1 family n=1 Tax=Thermostaphylospora chromogena TaxID=35622 RepID=A0A1H1G621_9ACTN|nr:carbohydrate ABC transporter permease [Thermostaphylospora chromogena]SDR08525.1 carbohydrate ABC transporter membrane protein 2, CUT1 family [Thermostaphylospora chromogena]
MSGRKTSVPKTVAWHVISVLLLVIVLYPLVWLIGGSFKESNEIVGSIDPFPVRPIVDNYISAVEGIAGIPATSFFLNSLIISALTVVGVVLSCSLAAYSFARLRFRGRNVMFAMMIATLLLPFHVMLIPQYIIFNNLGLVNTYVPLILPKFLAVDAFFVFLFVQFMRGIPKELDEAAKIDGAGHWLIFWRVLMPLARPAVITASIFAFIWSWNDFLGPLVYISDPERYPLPLALQLYIDQEQFSDYGAMIAMSMLSLVPILLFFLAFQRFLVQGVATSGMKG